MIKSIDHIVLTTRDLDKCLAFYVNVLGMKLENYGAGRIALAFGDQKFNVHPPGFEASIKALTPTPGSLDLLNAMIDAGGIVVRVARGPEPEWYPIAAAVNAGPKHIGWSLAKSELPKYNIHASETAWVGTDFDAIIDNNSTMDHLYNQLNCLIQDLHCATVNPVSESQ